MDQPNKRRKVDGAKGEATSRIAHGPFQFNPGCTRQEQALGSIGFNGIGFRWNGQPTPQSPPHAHAMPAQSYPQQQWKLKKEDVSPIKPATPQTKSNRGASMGLAQQDPRPAAAISYSRPANPPESFPWGSPPHLGGMEYSQPCAQQRTHPPVERAVLGGFLGREGFGAGLSNQPTSLDNERQHVQVNPHYITNYCFQMPVRHLRLPSGQSSGRGM